MRKEEILTVLSDNQQRGMVILVEGDNISYQFAGMGSGQAVDLLSQVRASLLEQMRDPVIKPRNAN